MAKTRRSTPYIFAAPATLVVVGLMVVPLLLLILYSLLNNIITEPEPDFVGIHHYRTLFEKEEFLQSLWRTAGFTVMSVLGHFIVGLGLATMLNSSLIGRRITALLRVVFVIPWFFTAAVVAVLWRLILDPHGVLNYFLTEYSGLDEPIAWFGNPDTALISLIVMYIWAGYPFFLITFLAGLQGVSGDLLEAAQLDGAGWMRRYRSVVIPQLRPILISMTMLDVLWTSQHFSLIWLTTAGGPLNTTQMVSIFTYRSAFAEYAFSQASAAAVVLVAFSMLVAVFYVRSQRAVSE